MYQVLGDLGGDERATRLRQRLAQQPEHARTGNEYQPIELVCERTADLHFRMLDSRDQSPVRYERVNSETGEETPWKEIVKGFEYSTGSYVVIPRAGQKAEMGYVLLSEVRQYLVALFPRGAALMVDLMRFPQEIVKPEEFTLPKGNSKSYRVTPAGSR